MDLRIVLDKWDAIKRTIHGTIRNIEEWSEYAEESQRVADEVIKALIEANLMERRELDLHGRTFSCRFHPTDWWHEVGCPHMQWTPEQLESAEETRQKFFDQHVRPSYSALFYGPQEWQNHVQKMLARQQETPGVQTIPIPEDILAGNPFDVLTNPPNFEKP